MRRLLAFAIVSGLLGVGAVTPAAADPPPPSCPDVDVAKCSVELRTGITMRYVEVGPADGQVVILLHGLTDSVRSWSYAMRELHELRPDLRIIAVDQRGHGGSSMPSAPWCPRRPEGCFRMKDFARDLAAFMDAKGIRTATFAGHSMGSVVAQEMGLRYRNRVEGVVLVASTASAVGNPALQDFVVDYAIEGLWRPAIEALGYTWPQDAWGLTPLDADPDAVEWMVWNWDYDPVADPDLVQAIAEDTARVSLGTFIGATKALLAVDTRQRLRHLRVPALVLWGGQDGIFYEEPDQADLIAALTAAARGKGSFSWKRYGVLDLPASGYQEDDIGHNVQWEAPREVALDIDAFLRTGWPTPDRYRTDAPDDITTIVTDPGQAHIISKT
jgi:pimeloyl-ACP methyl ester carboxylesterase